MNSQPVSHYLEVLRPLTTDERNAARAKATARMAGKQPTRQSLQAVTSESPAMRFIGTYLLGLVFAAGAIMSAFRLFALAYDLTLTAMEGMFGAVIIAVVSAVLMILLAETAQIVFMVAAARAETSTSRAIFYGLSIVAAIVAVTGNVAIEQPWVYNEQSLWKLAFAWLLSLTPPAAVLGVGYALKQSIVQHSQAQAAIEERYRAELDAYNATVEDASTAPGWKAVFATALYDALLQANARRKEGKAAIAELNTLDDPSLERSIKNALVYREMKADSWYDESIGAAAFKEPFNPEQQLNALNAEPFSFEQQLNSLNTKAEQVAFALNAFPEALDMPTREAAKFLQSKGVQCSVGTVHSVQSSIKSLNGLKPELDNVEHSLNGLYTEGV